MFIYPLIMSHVHQKAGRYQICVKQRQRESTSQLTMLQAVDTFPPLFTCLLVYKRHCTSKSRSIAGSVQRQ